MWKYLSYGIFGNYLPGEKVFILVSTKQAKNVASLSEVSKALRISKSRTFKWKDVYT